MQQLPTTRASLGMVATATVVLGVVSFIIGLLATNTLLLIVLALITLVAIWFLLATQPVAEPVIQTISPARTPTTPTFGLSSANEPRPPKNLAAAQAASAAPGQTQDAPTMQPPARNPVDTPTQQYEVPAEPAPNRPQVAVEAHHHHTAVPGVEMPTFGDPSRQRVDPPMPPSATSLLSSGHIGPHATVSDAYATSSYQVRAASRQGIAHTTRREPRQDNYLVTTAGHEDTHLVAIITDGLGSSEHSQFGSYWTARYLSKAIDIAIRERSIDLSSIILETYKDLHQEFTANFPGTDINSISTTLAALILPLSGDAAPFAFRIGDSDILQNTEDGGWQSVFQADHDEPIATTATAAFPSTQTAESAAIQHNGRCLLMVTDGIGGPIEQSPSVVGLGFTSWLQAPIHEIDLVRLISFERKSVNDDRTAVAIWHT